MISAKEVSKEEEGGEEVMIDQIAVVASQFFLPYNYESCPFETPFQLCDPIWRYQHTPVA